MSETPPAPEHDIPTSRGTPRWVFALAGVLVVLFIGSIVMGGSDRSLFRSELDRWLEKYHSNQDPPADLGLMLLLHEQKGWAFVEGSQEILAVETGVGYAKADSRRALPATVARFTIDAVNTRIAQREEFCVQFVGLHDAEFHVWRDFDFVECDDASRAVEAWKDDVRYRTTAA